MRVVANGQLSNVYSGRLCRRAGYCRQRGGEQGRLARLAERRVGLVRLRTAVAVLGFLQRAEAGEFVKEHKTPKRCY